MGREIQKMKRRSGRQPVRNQNRSKKILNPRGNNVVAQNWNKKETLAQNYRRLGLLARLKAPTGGVEKKLASASTGASTPSAVTHRTSKNDPFAITTVSGAIVSEAKVERDADGNIVRILGRTGARSNPLNDPLAGVDSDPDSGAAEDGAGADAEEWGGIDADDSTTDVVKSLIEDSRNEAPKKPRHQSDRETEWLQKLVARHGDDTAAMARDARLNPMQQTAADIRKRIKKMNQA